jgi:hypothetical protein
MREWTLLLGAVFLLRSIAFSQAINPEEFLAPRRVTNFTEQKLAASIKSHKHGNINDALLLQRSLARYFAGLGDSASASLCTQRAKAAELVLHPAPKPKDRTGAVAAPTAEKPGGKVPGPPETTPSGNVKGTPSAWSGKYYATVGGTLHKWDFNSDGTFMHQIIASGSGTGVRNLERGTFMVSGTGIELTIVKHVSAYTTPGVESNGRQSSQLGANAEAKAEKRKMKIRLLGNNGDAGIELDGETFKVRSWN